MCLEISMRPKGFTYMAGSAVFCMELDGFEIVYIIWKKKYIRRGTVKKGKKMEGYRS